MTNKPQKIVLPGGAGLVGQNLIIRLKQHGHKNLVVLDKHRANLAILRRLHPDITAEYADLAERGDWTRHFENASVIVMLQAQIGAATAAPFIRNNLATTELILATIRRYETPYTVHVSSSVVESVAVDDYTTTKRQQEQLVLESGITCVVLRPTLMFGWFDRKHLGWLSRFMHRIPVFPIPGHGRFVRQPLYAGDFCNLIISCIHSRISGKVFNITGLQRVTFIDIVRELRRATESRSVIVKIPYPIFHFLLRLWTLVDPDPPFTTDQLTALIAGDEFEIIDWERIFGIVATPFRMAIDETFCHPVYSKIVLEF
jgi:uncharacterized protein YbjT (DUF2867 family)